MTESSQPIVQQDKSSLIEVERIKDFPYPVKWLDIYGDIPYDTDFVDMSIYDLFMEALRKDPGVKVSEFEHKRIHSIFLMNRITKSAQGLYMAGVDRGDRVAVVMPSMPRCVSTIYGANVIGATPVIIDPTWSEEDIASQIDAFDCEVVVTYDGVKGKVAQAALAVFPEIPIVVAAYRPDMRFPGNAYYPLIAKRDPIKVPREAKTMGWRKFLKLAKSSGPMDLPKIKSDHVAAVFCQKGNTGSITSVALTAENLNVIALQTDEQLNVDLQEEALFCDLPVYTPFGFAIGIHATLANQGFMLLYPRMSPNDYPQLVLRKKAPVVYCSKNFFENVLESSAWKGKKLAFLKNVFCYEPLPDEFRARVNDFLAQGRCKTTLTTCSNELLPSRPHWIAALPDASTDDKDQQGQSGDGEQGGKENPT